MKKRILAALASFCITEAGAQYFEHVYGGSNGTYSRGSCITSISSGFCITGKENDPGNFSNISVAHPDMAGNVSSPGYFLNKFTVVDFAGKVCNAEGHAVTEYDNNGRPAYAVVGTIVSPNFNGLFFMRLDQNGNLITFKPLDYINYDNETPRSIVYNSTSNTLVYVGKMNPAGGGPTDLFITEVDAADNMVTQVLDILPSLSCPLVTSSDEAYDVIQDPYSGNPDYYYMVGKCNDQFGQIFGFLFGVSTTGLGAPILHLYHIGSAYNLTDKDVEFYAISLAAQNNGFIIGGKFRDPDDNFACVLVDAGGNISWSSFFDYAFMPGSDNICLDIKEKLTPMGWEYNAVGNVTGGIYGGDDIQLIRMDGSGIGLPMGDITFGSPAIQHAVGIEISGGIYITGETGAGGMRHNLIHTDDMGNFGPGSCQNQPTNVRPVHPKLHHYSPRCRPDPANINNDWMMQITQGSFSDYVLCMSVDVPPVLSKATGIKEHNGISSAFKAYPNPFNDMLTIEADNIGASINKIMVLNSAGQLMEVQDATEGNSCTLQTGKWESGLYLINIVDANGQQHVYRVTK